MAKWGGGGGGRLIYEKPQTKKADKQRKEKRVGRDEKANTYTGTASIPEALRQKQKFRKRLLHRRRASRAVLACRVQHLSLSAHTPGAGKKKRPSLLCVYVPPQSIHLHLYHHKQSPHRPPVKWSRFVYMNVDFKRIYKRSGPLGCPALW